VTKGNITIIFFYI